MCTGLCTTAARQLGTTIRFDIIMDGLKIPCGITMQAIEKLIGADRKDPVDTLQTHGMFLEELASRIVDSKRFEPDGSVLIRPEDLANAG